MIKIQDDLSSVISFISWSVYSIALQSCATFSCCRLCRVCVSRIKADWFPIFSFLPNGSKNRSIIVIDCHCFDSTGLSLRTGASPFFGFPLVFCLTSALEDFQFHHAFYCTTAKKLSFQQFLMQVFAVEISVKIDMVIFSCQLFSQSPDNFLSQSYLVFCPAGLPT